MNDLISQNPEMEQLIEAVFQIKDQLQGDYYEEGDIQSITECIQKFTEVYDAQTQTMNEHLLSHHTYHLYLSMPHLLLCLFAL